MGRTHIKEGDFAVIINGEALLLKAPIRNMLAEKVKHNGVSHGLAEAGYDIRVKQDIDFRLNDDPRVRYRAKVDDKEQAGNFVLASTIEEFDMPVDLVGIVHDKSTWARRGLSVFNTVIEPGWKGFLTLELVYHGQSPLFIPAGTGIAQVIFHQTALRASYDGKYQNQEDRPVGAKHA
jgi:dCTP deaminase